MAKLFRPENSGILGEGEGGGRSICIVGRGMASVLVRLQPLVSSGKMDVPDSVG